MLPRSGRAYSIAVGGFAYGATIPQKVSPRPKRELSIGHNFSVTIAASFTFSHFLSSLP
jgi:hypothetical protein